MKYILMLWDRQGEASDMLRGSNTAEELEHLALNANRVFQNAGVERFRCEVVDCSAESEIKENSP